MRLKCSIYVLYITNLLIIKLEEKREVRRERY